MRDVGLDDVNAAGLKVGANILTGEEALSKLKRRPRGSVKRRQCAERVTYSNGNGGLGVELLHLLNVSREKRLLDEERLVGLKLASELLGEGFVHTAVEVAAEQVRCQRRAHSVAKGFNTQSDVDSDRLDLFQALDGGIKSVRGIEPAELSKWGGLGVGLESWRSQVGCRLTDSTAFILTAVNPCSLRALACSRTSEGRSPPIQPYT